MTEPLITPTMKVAELLETWPALEDLLVAQAPAFKRLRNPVLRRTVARVATLEQAAGIAGLGVRELVAVLRTAVGQPVDPVDASPGRTGAGDEPPPDWLVLERVSRVVDANALLDQGAVPLNVVFEAARELAENDILDVTVSFRPIPLMDSLARQGYRCHLRAAAADRFHLYVTR